MRIMTASEASRGFSTLLDDAERGETITITREGQQVATVGPARGATWGALRAALADWTPPDDPTFDADMATVGVTATLDDDPWREHP